MDVRIYKPSKTAMQSAHGKTHDWVLEYETTTPRTPEALMGWVSSGDTLGQVRMKFPSAEEAIEFAKHSGWRYTVLPEHKRKLKPRNYSDNFKYIPYEDNAR